MNRSSFLINLHLWVNKKKSSSDTQRELRVEPQLLHVGWTCQKKRECRRREGRQEKEWAVEKRVDVNRWLSQSFLHICELMISHLCTEPIRSILCSSCPGLISKVDLHWQCFVSLINNNHHQPSGGGDMPELVGSLWAVSCGALCCDDSEAMWWQLHQALPLCPPATTPTPPSATQQRYFSTAFSLLSGQNASRPILTAHTFTHVVGLDIIITFTILIALWDFP